MLTPDMTVTAATTPQCASQAQSRRMLAVSVALVVSSIFATACGSSDSGETVARTTPRLTSSRAAPPTSTRRAPRAHAETEILRVDGELLGTVERDGEGGWQNGETLECWVRKTRRGWYAGMTHNELGGAVPAGPNRWNIFAGGVYEGSATRRSTTRWDVFSASGRLLAYTQGPDGGAAATAYLVTGICK